MSITKPVLLGAWKDGTVEDVFAEFEETRWNAYKESAEPPITERPEYKGVEILLANYGSYGYEGGAFVLFRRDGQLYEVNGSHCSCYGLENQWDPEPTTVEALRHRMTKGNLGSEAYDGGPFADELRQVLETVEKTQQPGTPG